MKQAFVTLRDATARELDSAAKTMYVSPTKYKWGTMARSICQGHISSFDKIYAIYRWICLNIAYDTDYKIYTADECIQARKGVCQAYCEMFYHLASAVGIKVDLVVGKVKHYYGMANNLHAWVMAYAAADKPVLMDPTWGAGSVNGPVFTPNKHIDAWFNVHPSWMILTHFPNSEVYQLLPQKVSFREFKGLPHVAPYLRRYGFTGSEMLEAALRGQPLPMPECYDIADVDALRIPHLSTLESGKTYTVHVLTKLPINCLGFLGDALALFSERWTQTGSVAVGTFKASGPGHVTLGIKESPADDCYRVIAKYNVI